MEVVKPFVKWAGGKGGLISQLKNFYPFDLENGIIERYVEPFIGGGAVLIDILQKYDVKEAYAFDINKDLINCYNVIKSNVEDLIEELDKKEKEFLKLETDDRTAYFYDIQIDITIGVFCLNLSVFIEYDAEGNEITMSNVMVW